MTLWRYSSGSKPPRVEDRIGGSRVGLLIDPLLHQGEAPGGLVDVVAVGDVDKSFEQLFKAFLARAERGGSYGFGAASGRSHDRPHSFVLSHLNAFPQGFPVSVQSHPAAG
jgi:hypothetical protein